MNDLYLKIKNENLKQWELAHCVFELHESGLSYKDIQINLYAFSGLKKSKAWVSKAVNFLMLKMVT